ncbi:peptidylprolyl isomerase [Novosphingobium olei]|uniref:peptidylprolyl isomerase n=1 Tax=Novosphingobium olei TaxID=2728851 RepID=UPI0030D12027
MHKPLLAAVLPLLAALAPSLAAAAPPVALASEPKPLAPLEIVGQAPTADWSAIAPADLLVMDLAPDAAGKLRRVVIQLLPPPFSQGWIGNIRKVAAAHWWDGTSINRVQDNYVVQWGDADGEDAAKAKPLPQGLTVVAQDQYTAKAAPEGWANAQHDAYAAGTGVVLGWPVSYAPGGVAPVHCYGTVGVGRNMPPDTGTGAELYAVIGHAPRQLDRNIAVVGRVIEGIEHLSSLPRGTGDLGFYKTAAERTPIRAIRLGTDVPDLPHYQYLSTESASFARYADARANRRDPFYIRPAGGADICNIPVPVRHAP